MKKLWSVLLSILLGAFVVGIGTGYFLYLANKDRQVLAQEANNAKIEAQQALSDSQKAIEETNIKLAQANQQVTNAQQALEALQNEQTLLKKAEVLLKPTTGSLNNWSSAISTSQGISLMYPPGSKIDTNNENILSFTSENSSSTPWLMILPYSTVTHKKFLSDMVSSTQVSYFVDGKVIAGEKGKNKNTDVDVGLLKIYSNGTSTQFIYIQDPPPQKSKTWQKDKVISFTEILRTFEFQK